MPDVRMNYTSMERMEKAFKSAAQTLEATRSAVTEIEKMMEGGALQGEAGDAFREAIRSRLVTRLNVLKDKMNELSRDINGAVIATRDGVSTAQSRFK